MFVIKKILGHLLMPLPLGIGLVTLGLLLLIRRRRFRGWTCLALGWVVLVVASNRAVSLALTASLEKTYAPVPAFTAKASAAGAAAVSLDPGRTGVEADVDAAAAAPPSSSVSADTTADNVLAASPLHGAGFVAVLGGGHGDAPALSAGQRLSTSARSRLMEGMRIAIALPETWLVVSGPRNELYGPAPDEATHARTLADAAVELGFPRERIVEIDTARDTAEEIAALRVLAGGDRVALVTSAWHLPRAMKLAAAAGLEAFPCPSDYLGGRDERIERLSYVTWDADSLMNTTRAWREYLGQGWARFVAWWRK